MKAIEEIKLGILAYATDTGLGNQTRNYVKYIVKDPKILAIDLHRFNRMPVHKEWYPNVWAWTNGFPSNEECAEFVKGLDCILYAENPLNYNLLKYARKAGVKTISAYNFEFLDYFNDKKRILPPPDLFAAPAKWNLDRVRSLNFAPVIELPVPIETDKIPQRKINKLETIIHIIGRPAFKDRNNTVDFLRAISLLGNRFRYKIFVQPPTDDKAKQYFKPILEQIKQSRKNIDIEVIENVDNYADIYREGDLLVLPRRYGGLCLPMQEALSSGIPVIMTDIEPNNTRLPKEWLVPAYPHEVFNYYTEIDVFRTEPAELAQVIAQFADPSFMTQQNKVAIKIAKDYSWESMREVYIDTISKLVNNMEL